MATWFSGNSVCLYLFNVAWQYDSRVKAYCDIKLFPDDPNGSNNSHAACSHPGTPPQACISSFTADGIRNICEQYFYPYSDTYSDPPVGVLAGKQIGTGLVDPTMKRAGVIPAPGVYPMSRKPVRSYHNGMWSGNYGLPIGWYIFMRFHPATLQFSPLVQINPLLIIQGSSIITPDNRNLGTNRYVKDGSNPNGIWSFIGSNNFTTWGPSSAYYRWDHCISNTYISNHTFSRFLFSAGCNICA
jgi:hypothetical protein